MLRLLCVTAHPDDEAGAFGGALMHYHDRGVETAVLCLTPGQAATNRGGARSDEELSAMRRAEFARAVAMLKVNKGKVLNYRDGQLDRANFLEAAGDIALRIRDFRPQVIITLGCEGAITGHVDHGMVGLFTTAAYHWAGREDRFRDQLVDGRKPYRSQKLYYATWLFTAPGRPPISPSPVTTILEVSQYLPIKLAAFKAHTSQNPLYEGFVQLAQQRGAKEMFHLVASSRPRRAAVERDLFAWVVED